MPGEGKQTNKQKSVDRDLKIRESGIQIKTLMN